MSGAKKNNGITFLANAGAFLKGLSLLQTLYVCLLGSSFAMSRFGYNPEAVGIFVGMCHNSIELFYLVSAIGAFVLLRCLDQFSTDGLKLKKWCSIVNSWVIVLLNVLLLKSYAWVEGNENIVLYYWTLIAANFFAGADDMIMYDIASHNVASYDLGQSCTGIFVAGLHWCTIYFLRKAKKDIDYGLNVCHIFVLLMLSLLAAMVWTIHTYREISSGTGGEASAPGNGGQGDSCTFLQAYGRVVPMMIMSTIGFGFIYVIYPLISPFEMVKPEDRYPIQSICTVAHAVLGILLWLLEQHAGLSDKWTGKTLWYYAVYLLVVPYLAIGAVFIVSMHYPESTLGRAVRMKPLVVGILTVCFYVAGRACITVSNISINGNAKGTDGNCKCTHGSTLSSMNLGVNLLVLSISKYISEGYIQKYIVTRNLAAESHQWPTDGMSTIQAFHYWLQVGWQEGLKNFRGTFDQDVREKLAHALLTND